MVLTGRVASGTGDLARWMTVHAAAYATATGMALYPGSLNLVLDEPWPLPSARTTLPVDEVGRLVHLVPCTVRGRRCFIFRTDRAERSGEQEQRVLEILADVCLRDALAIVDGDALEVVVDDKSAR